jgi:ubiquinone/menaquinone biosynthesis C-methylase UbiE
MNSAAEAFDRCADEFDAWFESPEGKALFRAEVDSVKTIMKGLEPPFLGIGVGSGRFAEALGIEYGIDPSPVLLEKARARGVKAVLGEGERLPYEDEEFGGVFVLFTLCFVEDPFKVLTEAKRVLKPNGGLIVGIINRRSPWGLLYSKKKSEGHPLYKFARFYGPDEVVGLLAGAGLSVTAFSSTLLRPPSDIPMEELVLDRLREGAGFICMLARKSS